MYNDKVFPSMDDFTKNDWIRAGIGWTLIVGMVTVAFKMGKKRSTKSAS